ncbi:unnamed protein product, partial [Vitis vinifera]|uniref:Uncharacterized protein n=1 Tax=Vitis vinifera TaxID=29760 RepID=D7TSB7_VITVI
MVGASSLWSRALVQISPYTFSAISIAIAIGGNLYNWKYLIGTTIKAPRITSKNLINEQKGFS